MLVKKINNSLYTSATIANFLMKIGYAVILAKVIWWLFTPAYNNIYVSKNRLNRHDISAKYIINRYPFGEIVVEEHKNVAPAITSLLKLNGVYVSGNNSMAFLKYNGKSMVVKLDDHIVSDVVLSSVDSNSIEVNQNGNKATIKITSGDNNPNTPSVNSTPNNNVVAPPSSNLSNDNGNYTAKEHLMHDLDRRREMLEKFEKQEVGNNNEALPPDGTQGREATAP